MRQVVTLENPLSESLSIMRPTLLGSLLGAAAHNAARGAGDLALFESGTVYRAAPDGPLAAEHQGLAVLVAGALSAEELARGPAVSADFFAAKGLLAGVLDALGIAWTLAAAPMPFLHPGRSASVLAGETRLGFIGELHPLVAASWDLERVATWALNLDLVASLAPEVAPFTPFAEYPPLRQDLAVAVSEAVDGRRGARHRPRGRRPAARAGGGLRRLPRRAGGGGPGVAGPAPRVPRPGPDAERRGCRPSRQAIAAALAARLGGELRA